WLSRLGIGMLAYFAEEGGGGGGVAGTATAHQPHRPPYGQGCCGVAFPNGPYCPYTHTMSHYTCPQGHRHYWVCGQGTSAVGCGECTSGSSCWQGHWYCSTWWKVNP